eukprot:CAMPEP_0197921146 /NCGR_PEP_ID=MMETSP1439-20131203/90130_1 /TAXON_ID=66791 /ORGANISM="Gonyaulax spinifera, Strain CCMP409" /LENGTH=197 /DNA_ID=CAMNT_0043543383 /DNA_START=8 /DNA_END=602 /DNA_ORIENTATION=+
MCPSQAAPAPRSPTARDRGRAAMLLLADRGAGSLRAVRTNAVTTWMLQGLLAVLLTAALLALLRHIGVVAHSCPCPAGASGYSWCGLLQDGVSCLNFFSVGSVCYLSGATSREMNASAGEPPNANGRALAPALPASSSGDFSVHKRLRRSDRLTSVGVLLRGVGLCRGHQRPILSMLSNEAQGQSDPLVGGGLLQNS